MYLFLYPRQHFLHFHAFLRQNNKIITLVLLTHFPLYKSPLSQGIQQLGHIILVFLQPFRNSLLVHIILRPQYL